MSKAAAIVFALLGAWSAPASAKDGIKPLNTGPQPGWTAGQGGRALATITGNQMRSYAKVVSFLSTNQHDPKKLHSGLLGAKAVIARTQRLLKEIPLPSAGRIQTTTAPLGDWRRVKWSEAGRRYTIFDKLRPMLTTTTTPLWLESAELATADWRLTRSLIDLAHAVRQHRGTTPAGADELGRLNGILQTAGQAIATIDRLAGAVGEKGLTLGHPAVVKEPWYDEWFSGR